MLADNRSGGSFSTRRTAPADDLATEIVGVGPVCLPVSAAQAKELRLIARPAKYGHGEQTILDRRVRDTWEIPLSRVRIDKRRWNRTLHPMLDTIRQDLGLPETCSLKAALHSMLVYEPQQFFAAHQDSEKDDAMIGSLVVMLPSNSRGGELRVEHRGDSVEYRGSASSLTFVAFYSDTRHEVLPVESGYRVVLTYDLAVVGDTSAIRADPKLAAAAAELLEGHFSHAPQPRWRGDSQALEPPDRLVFLLDHQYTGRSLAWPHLKGVDATRAAVLRSAAQRAGCEMALAQAEIHETWDAFDSAPGDRRYRDWPDWDDNHDEVEVGDLIDSSITIVPAAGQKVSFYPDVEGTELVAVTPSVELAPYETEHTGYMGNWGNTMDRWYRRAAIVMWPQARSFAVRAKGDPLAALHELLETSATDPHAAQMRMERVSALLRSWPEGVRRGDQVALLPPTLRLAWELNDESAANALLEPFAIEALKPTEATVLLALAEQHGGKWFDRRLTTWVDHRSKSPWPGGATRAIWVESLPDLCVGLRHDQHAPGDLAADVARSLVNRMWEWMRAEISRAASIATPSRREAALRDLAVPLLAVLRSSVVADDLPLRQTIIDTVCDPTVRLSPMLVRVVEASTPLPREQLEQLDVGSIAQHLATTLQAELVRPERAADDWSITEFESGDCCDDCEHLAAFLADPAQQQSIWPLAKPRRRHIHQRIDEAELPVTHQTRRQGSPHKLILAKTPALFTRDAARRSTTESTLESIQRLLATVR